MAEISPDRDRVFLMLPAGVPLSMAAAVARLFSPILPGGGMAGGIGDASATLSIPEGMTLAVAAAQIDAAADLLADTEPSAIDDPDESDGRLSRLTFDDEEGMTVGVGGDDIADRTRDFVKRLACEMLPAMKSMGAENYLEWRLRHPDQGEWTLSVTRPGGLTPHGARQRAETELAEARAEVARLRSAGDGAADARLRRLRHQIGEWAERINKHDVPDEFVSYVDADQRLLDIIWEMRDAAKEVDR